jgi:ATP-dependent RNA helicase DDX18/HAS1
MSPKAILVQFYGFLLNNFQYDPPDEPREYIHRVGRTARGDTGTGNALLILRPEELGFLRFLKVIEL